MRRSLSIILTFGLALIILIALSLAGNVNLYREDETENEPIRSSFNAGPTGTRAFYQLLEESGFKVSRWRQSFGELKNKAPNGILLMVGPYAEMPFVQSTNAAALHDWLKAGGRALVISRSPNNQLGGLGPYTHSPASKLPDPKAPAEQLVYDKSDTLVRQPTRLTRDLKGLALSQFATRIYQQTPPPPPPKPEPTETVSENADEEAENSDEAATVSPTPAEVTKPVPPPPAKPTPTPDEEVTDEDIQAITESHTLYQLPDPVVHMGDDDGAVLADYDYGQGRIIVLTDPFVVANNGILRGSNLQLAQNLLRELGADTRPIFFDEYHHGYRSETNAIINYFRGTPFGWVLGQLLLLTCLVIYSLGKRFARPLPLPQPDRHSPLEFVGSMASLQQAAEANDLALENIYPKFKARLCRRLGLSVRAKAEEITAAVQARPRYAPYAERLTNVIHTSEEALHGGAYLPDKQLVELVYAIRTLNAEMK